jgi:GAF domain-containing protein
MTDTYERVIARFASILASLQDVDPLVERLCEAGRQMLGADGAALVLPADEQLRVTVCATDDLASSLEDVQVVVAQGPTVTALETGLVMSADVGQGEDGRWPLFHERVTALGFDGVVTAVPLTLDQETVGVLMVHDTKPTTTGDNVYRFLGASLAAALLEDPLIALGGPAGDGRWTSQAKVHQATGMVIAQVGVRTTDALALLRAQAFSTGASLLEVAQHVIERHINFRDFTVEGD